MLAPGIAQGDFGNKRRSLGCVKIFSVNFSTINSEDFPLFLLKANRTHFFLTVAPLTCINHFRNRNRLVRAIWDEAYYALLHLLSTGRKVLREELPVTESD